MSWRGSAVAALVVATILAGCSEDVRPASGAGKAPPASVPASASAAPPVEDWGDPAPAAAGGKSAPACALPVAFDVASKWTAKAVGADAAAAFGGPDTVACEVDGKPAGIIGFIRVYVAKVADPRAALQEHLTRATKADGQRFRQITTPAGAGWEVGYQDEDSPVRAFAVPAGSGTVVVEWGGLDEEEHRAGLPAYGLARASLARS